ncbi:unnamed protein product [Dracunculus medinensis]|uniref:DNA-directed RNA polymerase III subunit RPC6 n=1 Tax=Dracunculus medinensis TaxID=318479 RepID=A0A3P7S9B4_DRAME|nr:unnamed protein product [Dracunculus medinensis]
MQMKMDGEEKVQAEAVILSILSVNQNGLPIEEIMQKTGDMGPKVRENAVNSLLSSGKIEMLQGRSVGSFSLRLRRGTQLTDATAEEQLVSLESKRKGIWIRDIRDKTGLSMQFLRKILKGLEQRKLVRAIKSVGNTKKCYILHSVDPDDSLTGGTFYSDQQLDSQFVDTLVEICISMIENKRKSAENTKDILLCRELSFVTSAEVAQFISEKKISKVHLSVANCERILSIAVLDGLLEQRADGSYRALDQATRVCAIAHVPCVHCSVYNDCKAGYAVSPENCELLADWLEMF